MENTKKLYESEQKELNIEKYGNFENCCICCGKPIKDVKFFVHMNTDWVAVRPPISEENCLTLTGAESQGLFAIGSDCAKKMKGFIYK